MDEADTRSYIWDSVQETNVELCIKLDKLLKQQGVSGAIRVPAHAMEQIVISRMIYLDVENLTTDIFRNYLDGEHISIRVI